jgi:hypothetical protein
MRDTIDMAREAGVSIRGHYDETGSTPQELKAFEALVRADEREACAKVCDEVDKESQSQWPKRLATMIRSRGQP